MEHTADSRDGLSALVRPSGITLPTYTVGPMNSVRIGSYELDVYAFLLIACGWWTVARYGCVRLSRAGFAAVKLTLLAGTPIIVAGMLIALGVRTGPPSALEVMTAPLFMLPQHWLFGYSRWGSRPPCAAASQDGESLKSEVRSLKVAKRQV